MNKVFETTSTVITHRIINTEEIEGTDFVFYIYIREINEDEKSYTKIYKGVTSKENIHAVTGMKDIKDQIKAPKMYNKEAIVAAINKNNYRKVMNGDLHITDAVEDLGCIDYTEDKYILVLWNWGSYKIADLNYNFISIPINFGYVDGCVDNQRYDLNKLIEKLKNDKHVCYRKELKITNIPYYNCDYENGKTKSIEFKYLLPNDIYNEIIGMDSFMMRQYILRNIIGAKECEIN